MRKKEVGPSEAGALIKGGMYGYILARTKRRENNYSKFIYAQK